MMDLRYILVFTVTLLLGSCASVGTEVRYLVTPIQKQAQAAEQFGIKLEREDYIQALKHFPESAGDAQMLQRKAMLLKLGADPADIAAVKSESELTGILGELLGEAQTRAAGL